jgi:hypothetical protein
MANERDIRNSRIVILAADVCSYSAPVVTLAAEIAASVKSKLQGVFIEDQDLLTLSSSPLTREISLTTAGVRPASSERMQRMLRAAAQQFESALQREAQALNLVWSYEYVRGRTRDISLKVGLGVGFAIFGGSGQRRVESGVARATRRVLVVAGASTHWEQVLAVVTRRFAGQKKQIVLVGDGAEDDPGLDLRRLVDAPRSEIETIRVERAHLSELLRRSGPSFDFAILPMEETAEALAPILEALQCPVVLVA